MAVLAFDDWYELVDHEDLDQGDFVQDVAVVDPDAVYLRDENPEQAEAQSLVEFFKRTVIVSQQCDLVLSQGNEFALVCPVFTINELESIWGLPKLKDNWENARKGQLVHYFPLRRCTIPGHEFAESFVAFERVIELRIPRIRQLCQIDLKVPRLRMRSPYKYEIVRRLAHRITRIPYSDLLPDWKTIKQNRQSPGAV